MAKILWIVEDCLGKQVELSSATWESHVAKRPYMGPHRDKVREVVENPDICMKDETNAFHNYSLGILPGKWRKLYLRVIVRRFRGKRSQVVSFFASKQVDPGEIKWFNKSS